MEKNIYIDIQNNESEAASIITDLNTYSIDKLETHSSAGLELVTFILSIGEFCIALIEIPSLIELINRKKITVKFGGYKLNDSIDQIIDIIKSNPVFLESVKKAVTTNTIEIEGKGNAVKDFWTKLNSLVNAEDE